MPHLITPITLQGVSGYDLTFVQNSDGSRTSWPYGDPLVVCCQSTGLNVFPGTTRRLYQSLNHPGYEVSDTKPSPGELELTVLNTGYTPTGLITGGSIRFGVCCAGNYASFTMRGQMRSQSAYEGNDWCKIYVNGVLKWEHAASNAEGRAYFDALVSNPDLADDNFQTYLYEEAISVALVPDRACGNIIEIRSSSGVPIISQAEMDADPSASWNGLRWQATLSGLA